MGNIVFGDYEGTVYSPSQTAIYKECPMAWFLRYQSKYISRTYNHKEIAGAVGSAFSTYQEHIELGIDKAKELAHEDMDKMLTELRDTRELSERAGSFLLTASDRLDKFIHLFNRDPKIPVSWTMFDRERAFEDYGNCRIDSAYETSMGDIGILDFKTRGRIQANQRAKAQREFATSNQMYHYCAVASEVYGVPVEQFSILMLTLEPKPWVEIWQYRIKRPAMAAWIAGRKQDWADMDAIKRGERTPSMATEHENKFGLCTYFDVCFKHGFVKEHVDQDFIIRK